MAGVVVASLVPEHQTDTSAFCANIFCFLSFSVNSPHTIPLPSSRHFRKVEAQFVLVKKRSKIPVSRNNGICICFVLVIQEILFYIRKPSFTKHKHDEFKYLKPNYGTVCVASTPQPCHTWNPHQEDLSVSTVGRYGSCIHQSLIWKDGIGWLGRGQVVSGV